MGGSVALITATRRDLGEAAVTFYGGGVTEGRFGFGALVDEAPALQAPWLGLYGDLTPRRSPSPAWRSCASPPPSPASPPRSFAIRMPGHGFNCDQRADYHEPSATRHAWRRMGEWFDHHLQ